jgi:hypothetical protein
MDRYRVSYSAVGMSEEASMSASTSKASRNVNFTPEMADGIPQSVVDTGRRESKFFQRPRSLSVWSTTSLASRRSYGFDER